MNISFSLPNLNNNKFTINNLKECGVSPVKPLHKRASHLTIKTPKSEYKTKDTLAGLYKNMITPQDSKIFKNISKLRPSESTKGSVMQSKKVPNLDETERNDIGKLCNSLPKLSFASKDLISRIINERDEKINHFELN